jgi:diadenosine tetraphosphate (Ap4A) HIT family hydrolase
VEAIAWRPPARRCTIYSVPTCPLCTVAPGDCWGFNEYAVALPNRSPIAPGHALVAPRRHVALFYELDVQEQRAVWDMVSAVKKAVAEDQHVSDFHLGFADFNRGDGHAHVHVIPRGLKDDAQLPHGIEWVKD